MSLSPRSVAIGIPVVGIIAFVVGGIVGFRDYAPGRVAPMWPMLLLAVSMLVVSIPIALRRHRRRR
jgi:hypothetical protein